MLLLFSFVVIVSVDLYVTNIKRLRETISAPAFVESLKAKAQAYYERMINESKARGPKYVRRNGDKLWEIGYDEFNEIVDRLPEGLDPAMYPPPPKKKS